MKNKLNITIAGLGTVGSDVILYIEKNIKHLEKITNSKIYIGGICAKNKKKERTFSIFKYKWYNDPIKMIEDLNPDVFVELMGHEKGISYKSIKFALKNKVNVITANKALIANFGNEFIHIAEKNNVHFLFEAAVAGGIPIIKTIKESLIINKITKISGILNGTTNYILTKMLENNFSFDEALNNAKNKGYVEINPKIDIDGIDSAHKLSILTSLCFGLKFHKFSDIYKEGISNIDYLDLKFALQLNLILKLLSVVELIDNKLIQYVKPILVNKDSQIGQVTGVLNGIQITTNELGKIFFEGPGAGGVATASSIISDLKDICINSPSLPMVIRYNDLSHIKNINILNLYSSFYIRLTVEDKHGVLAKITSLLKDNDISIETIIQKQNDINNNLIPVVITTHKTYYKNIIKSVDKIRKLKSIKHNPVVIQIDKV